MTIDVIFNKNMRKKICSLSKYINKDILMPSIFTYNLSNIYSMNNKLKSVYDIINDYNLEKEEKDRTIERIIGFERNNENVININNENNINNIYNNFEILNSNINNNRRDICF